MFSNFMRQLPPVTKNLLIVNLIFWAAMAFVPALDLKFTQYGALYYWESPGFGVWQLVSYMFLHANFSHLFFNMFALLMFGGIIEWTLGSKRFLFYYLSCGVGAALIQEAVFSIMMHKYHVIFGADFAPLLDQAYTYWQQGLISGDPTVAAMTKLAMMPTIGASGAVFGILLAFGMLYPNREMFIMFIPVAIKAKWMVIGYGVLELLMGISSVDDSVAHFAHLGGMIFGFLMLYYWKKKGDFRGWY